MPNIRQLEILVALADTLHFRKAAERTNTTQPNVSEQLRALERRLGAQLFERSRARVLITPIGEQVVSVARRILKDLKEMQVLASSGGRDLEGLLRLGVPPTIGPYLLPHVMPELHNAYPALKLYVREDIPKSLPIALEAGSIDVALTILPIGQGDLESVILFREPLLLAVACDHPWAERESVTATELRGSDLLALGPGHQLHDVALTIAAEFGANVRREFEGTSLDTLREMVIMGLGITFLPGLYAHREIVSDPNIKILELEGRALHRTVGLSWRRSSARAQAYASLARSIRQVSADRFGSFGTSFREEVSLGQQDAIAEHAFRVGTSALP